VKDPAEALARARENAARARAAGEYPALADEPRDAKRELARYALVEPDRAQVYSTRSYGAPITAFKRLLIRLLRQYLDQVIAQQSRFNAHAAAYILELEDRVERLEQERDRS
jgi:hypothetical protein